MEAQTQPPPSSPSGNGRRPEEPLPEDDPHNPAARAIHDVPIYIAELKAYARHFISAKIDGVKATVRQMVMYTALGMVALLTTGGVLFAAIFLLLSGLAMGLGRLFGGRYWLGNLVVGVVVLGGVWLGVRMMVKKLIRAGRLKTEQKYDRKQLEERREFGRDVHERAAEPGSGKI
jgi:hypothetical protein